MTLPDYLNTGYLKLNDQRHEPKELSEDQLMADVMEAGRQMLEQLDDATKESRQTGDAVDVALAEFGVAMAGDDASMASVMSAWQQVYVVLLPMEYKGMRQQTG